MGGSNYQIWRNESCGDRAGGPERLWVLSTRTFLEGSSRVVEKRRNHDGSLFRDTLVVYFYKGVPDSVYTSFVERAQAIEAKNDSTKRVEIDNDNYFYEDQYLNGFSCYLGVRISKTSPYGEIIYGNWRPEKND